MRIGIDEIGQVFVVSQIARELARGVRNEKFGVALGHACTGSNPGEQPFLVRVAKLVNEAVFVPANVELPVEKVELPEKALHADDVRLARLFRVKHPRDLGSDG